MVELQPPLTPSEPNEFANDSNSFQAKARRVNLVDQSGNYIDAANPLPIDDTKSLQSDPTTTSVSVGTSATKLPTTALTGRLTMTLSNIGTATVYIGGSGVTTSNGEPLEPGFKKDIDASDTSEWYGVVATSTEDVIVTEVK